MTHYTQISTERQFKAATGKSKAEFELLKIDFEKHYFEKYGQPYDEYIEESVYETPKLKDLGLGEALFFVLFHLKNGLTWDSLGVVFGGNYKELRRYAIHLYNECHAAQPLIYQHLKTLGVDISTGQVNNILKSKLIEGKG